MLDGEKGQKRLNEINSSDDVRPLFALLDELACPNAASFKLHHLHKEEKARLAEKERRKTEDKRIAEDKKLCSDFDIRFLAAGEHNYIQFFGVNSKGDGDRARIELNTEEEVNELKKSSPLFPKITSVDFSRYKERGEVAKTKCQKFFAAHLAKKDEGKKPSKKTGYKPVTKCDVSMGDDGRIIPPVDVNQKRKHDETKEKGAPKIKKQRL